MNTEQEQLTETPVDYGVRLGGTGRTVSANLKVQAWLYLEITAAHLATARHSHRAVAPRPLITAGTDRRPSL